ncbi:GNAT family N-acetyltransferase [Vibrio sp. EA2]|uniref:GNAT family N-acetyltransferase n=1 Tax=Vibrio sp. EA2 TaxID=3079860 RepID=UPI0029490017|nr:GNAT family N-acetyltransferase [Vibrio sp. EA2]MDV6249724.1 GNAT family N-acetyltransferase [Vibrio sp. EA2]
MQQNIVTDRLVLRPFVLSDAERVAILAGEKLISDMTANIPYPYSLTDAESWIETHEQIFAGGKGIVYAITLKDNGELIGAVSLPKIENGAGTLGYWLGVPYWGNGYATEASRALILFSKQNLGVTTLRVMHLVGNERSKSVIRKLGVTYMENRTSRMQGKEREVCVYTSEL